MTSMATSHDGETKKRKRESSDEETSQMITEENQLEKFNSDADIDNNEKEDKDDADKRYNHGSEKLPDHPAFDSDLEDAMITITNLIIKFEKISRLHASGSEALQNMHANAEALCERPKPTPPTFAVIGVRASGKFEIKMINVGLAILLNEFQAKASF